ncbi:hypothetical protein [Streptomyces cyslabdanicus]|uniref:hypothetical protein n=1 Tax=Streptomyces cyslabdanicus TaxID=1470456 RepID=UPI00404482EF
MSTLVQLVALLLVLVTTIVFGGLTYLVHRHPAWGKPLTVGLTGVGVLATVMAAIVSR